MALESSDLECWSLSPLGKAMSVQGMGRAREHAKNKHIYVWYLL